MLWSGRITLMIMINAMVLTQSSADEEPIRRFRSSPFSPLVSQRKTEDNYIRHVGSKGGRSKHHMKCDRNLNHNVKHINIRLKNVFDKYDSKRGEMKALYAAVEPCVPDKCGRTRHVFPGNLPPKRFMCANFKNCKHLKKGILRILSKFHAGVQHFTGEFENLTIPLLRKERKNSGSRLRILNGFKSDLKTLNLEIEAVMTKKRLKFSCQRKSLMAGRPPPLETFTTSHTSLLINEWLTLQELMKYLGLWLESLRNVFNCWKETNRKFKRGGWST